MVEGPNGPTEVKYDEVYGTVAFAIRISPTEGEARERRAQTQQQIEETQLFRLYPNPSDNQFMIESLSGHRKVSSLTVSDVTGKVVLAEYNISLESPHAVNTSRLSPGSYFVRLVDTSGKGHFLRFVKLD